MRKLFVVYAAATLVLFGCASSDVRSTYEEVNTNSDAEKTEMATSTSTEENSPNMMMADNVGFGFIEEDLVFSYDGNPLSIPLSFEILSATGHDSGLMVFIAGVPQSFSIEYEDGTVSEKGIMQKTPFTEEKKEEIHLLVDPNVGKKGDNLGMYICNIIYPSFRPDSIEQPSYQYCGWLAQLSPQQVGFEVDARTEDWEALTVENGLELSDDIQASYLAFGSGSVEENLDGIYYVDLYQEEKDEKVVISENGMVSLHLRWYGGVDGIYNTTIFINDEPVSIQGADYIQSEAQRNKMSQCDIVLDVSEYDELNTIYAFTAPADDAYLEKMPVIKTNSKLLVNDLKQESAKEEEIEETEETREVSQETQKTEEMGTSQEDWDVINFDEGIVKAFDYFIDEEEQEMLLYLNDESELVLYNCTTEQEVNRYSFAQEEYNVAGSEWLGNAEDAFYLYVEFTQEKKMDLGEDEIALEAGVDAAEKREVYRFDSQLHCIDQYDLDAILPGCSGVQMSQNGNKLILSAEDEICFYDLESGAQTQADAAILNQLKDITISNMALSSDEKKLAFLGSELNQNDYEVYGVIDLDSQEVTIKQTESNYGNEWHQVGDIVFITDGEIPKKDVATGKIKCMNLETGEIFDFAVDNKESTTACLSKDQSRLVAMSDVLSEGERIGWKISMYDFESQELIWQRTLEEDGRLIGFVASDKKALLIFYSEDGSRKIFRTEL